MVNPNYIDEAYQSVSHNNGGHILLNIIGKMNKEIEELKKYIEELKNGGS